MQWKWIGLLFLVMLSMLPACSMSEPVKVAATRQVEVTSVATREIPEVTRVTMCTAMGCQDSVVVNFTGNIPDAFTVQLTLLTGGQSQTAVCSDGVWQRGASNLEAPCDRLMVLPAGSLRSEMEVEAAWGEGETAVATLTPTLEDFYPNGPDCEPVCQLAIFELIFP